VLLVVLLVLSLPQALLLEALCANLQLAPSLQPELRLKNGHGTCGILVDDEVVSGLGLLSATTGDGVGNGGGRSREKSR